MGETYELRDYATNAATSVAADTLCTYITDRSDGSGWQITVDDGTSLRSNLTSYTTTYTVGLDLCTDEQCEKPEIYMAKRKFRKIKIK